MDVALADPPPLLYATPHRPRNRISRPQIDQNLECSLGGQHVPFVLGVFKNGFKVLLQRGARHQNPSYVCTTNTFVRMNGSIHCSRWRDAAI